MTPHPHQALITLWAAGHTIDYLTPTGNWLQCANPVWLSNATYSIKLPHSRIISPPNGVTFEPSPQP